MLRPPKIVNTKCEENKDMLHYIKDLFGIPDERERVYGIDRFNHCSTICMSGGYLYLAWYGGERECHKTQKVFVRHKDSIIPLPNGTGNPVLFNYNGKPHLLYSIFTRDDVPPVAKWKYCDLEVRNLVDRTSIKISDSDAHLLGRCRPVRFRGRNFSHSFKQCELYISDDAINWDGPHNTNIPNINHSVCFVKAWGRPLIIWNDVSTPKRNNLSIGEFDSDYLVVDYINRIESRNSSYPTALYYGGLLYISYTRNGKIVLKSYNKSALEIGK